MLRFLADQRISIVSLFCVTSCRFYYELSLNSVDKGKKHCYESCILLGHLALVVVLRSMFCS